jgi:GxxExxY protein
MPIHVGADIRWLNDEEYKALVYEVMRHFFAIQSDLGRLFDEKIYQREIAFRIPDAQREVPVELHFQGFRKTYYLDLLVGAGAIFELKTAQSLTHRHRSQLLNYLFLTGLPHGKLVNLRPERVEHEFVNNTLTIADRTAFVVADDGWQELGTAGLKEGMTAMLRDWGAGLDLGLYEEVAAQLCGQPPEAETAVEIHTGLRSLGFQYMLLAASGVAIRITALPPDHHPDYEAHLHRLLAHADLRAVQWINITRPVVQFKTIRQTRI